MLKKNRETFYASLNDYLTVEAIKSNICQENEIIIKTNDELLKPDGFVKSPTVLS